MAWHDVGETVQSFVTAGGIIAGGVFTYYKFGKDRIYRPRVDLGIDAGYVDAGPDAWLKCVLTARNMGGTKLALSHRGTAVIVTPPYADADGTPVVHWNARERLVVDIFGQHDWIESTESIRDEIVVRAPAVRSQPQRVQLRLVVAAPSPLNRGEIEIWTSRIVAPGERWPLTRETKETEAGADGRVPAGTGERNGDGGHRGPEAVPRRHTA